MKCFALPFVFAAFVLVAGHAAWAREKDTVYVRQAGKKKDEAVKGTIQQESPAGIKLRTDKNETVSIPVPDIRAVDYGEGIDVVGRADYRSADSKLERALLESSPKRKADGLESALVAFRELANNDKLRNIPSVNRYLHYRIAQTTALLAQDEANRRDAAFTALKEFKTAFADGWEIVSALQLLASLQEDKGDTAGASNTCSELAELSGVSPALRLQSQLKSARLLMRVPRFREAEEKLKQLESAMPADDPQRTFVDVYLIQAQIAQKRNLDGIDKKLEKILQGGKDDSLRALAHNALGDYYRAKGDDAQAFWEYCKVDMLYNQDREEHAKALYYLSHLFDKPPRNNPTRAEEFLTRLKSSQFDGTLFQRLAASEKKKGE